MPGRIIDLASTQVLRLPPEIVVDSDLLIAQFMQQWRTGYASQSAAAQQFFRLLATRDSVGVVTSTTLAEVSHFLLLLKLRADVPQFTAQLQSRYSRQRGFDWKDLYKLHPLLLQTYAHDLSTLMTLILRAGLLILQPEDLGSIVSGRTLQDELIHLIQRYQLESHDAMILLEARRYRLHSIASMDTDMRRAAVDFDVYTWI